MHASQRTLDLIRLRWDRIDRGLPPEIPEYILSIPNYGIVTYTTEKDPEVINQRLLEICAANPDTNILKYEASLGFTMLDFEISTSSPAPTHDTIMGDIE